MKAMSKSQVTSEKLMPPTVWQMRRKRKTKKQRWGAVEQEEEIVRERENSKGHEKITAAVVVKDLNDLIQKIIEKNMIKAPLVTFGLDGGQGKFLITMHV
mgnify:CR=1 FL=1